MAIPTIELLYPVNEIPLTCTGCGVVVRTPGDEPRCPKCGYTVEDATNLGDHRICDGQFIPSVLCHACRDERFDAANDR